ncbi:MAG: patatin-like phospholipase family protein [Acidimicrobiales bacterium]
MLQALAERRIRPDLVIGASVGAVTAAWLATAGTGGDLAWLAQAWRSMRRGTVFLTRLRFGLGGLLGRRSCMIEPSAFRRRLARHLPGSSA